MAIMNLKTFAIHQKLSNSNDELLKYVMNDKPVPISVLEQSFSHLLYPLQDEYAEALVTNHMEVLNKTVPLIVTVLPSGGYNISGEIPDNIMEIISLVHNTDENSIVTQIINHQLSSIYKKKCDIEDLTIDRSVASPPVQVLEPVKVTEPLTESEPIDEGFVKTEETFTDVETESFDESFTDMESESFEEPAMMDESFEEEEVFDETPDDLPDEEVSAFEDELIPDDSPDEDVIKEIDENSRAEPELDPEVQKQQQVTEAIRRIYTKFCDDLVKYRLDERLNLNL